MLIFKRESFVKWHMYRFYNVHLHHREATLHRLRKYPSTPIFAEKAIFAEWPILTIYTKKVYIQPINLFAMSILPSPPLVVLYPSLGRNVSHMGGKIRARCPEICRGRENGVTEKVQSLVDPICFV